MHKLISIVSNWWIKSGKNFLQNHAVPGLLFKECSRDEVDHAMHIKMEFNVYFKLNGTIYWLRGYPQRFHEI